MPSIPMNMTRTFSGDPEDALTIVTKLMEEL